MQTERKEKLKYNRRIVWLNKQQAYSSNGLQANLTLKNNSDSRFCSKKIAVKKPRAHRHRRSWCVGMQSTVYVVHSKAVPRTGWWESIEEKKRFLLCQRKTTAPSQLFATMSINEIEAGFNNRWLRFCYFFCFSRVVRQGERCGEAEDH